ncbi:T9SS type A sorting domain-containing protein [uncultured Planktosalinus sp.]|uniref:T9SS type A sorting domain-containing protein n=1 Tax=uncultured Planktosalinus sp. TaxID=1810935 RepID=UPI0030D82B53
MKKIILAFIFLINYPVTAQEVTVPDPVFMDVLLNELVIDQDFDGFPDSPVDFNQDGIIDQQEVGMTINLHLVGYDIQSFEDIEQFPSILDLFITNNNFSAIDMSGLLSLREVSLSSSQPIDEVIFPNTGSLKEIRLINNGLPSVDVSMLPNLERLWLSGNNLSELDITQNTQLLRLMVYDNNITEIDLSQNVNLTHINLNYNNLSTIDISQNSSLISIQVSDNPLTEIDVTQNQNLRTIFISDTEITGIELSQNSGLLQFFSENTPLEGTLDLSNNPEFLSMRVNNTNLTAIDIQNGNNHNINTLNIYEITVLNNPNLQCLQVDDEAYATQMINEGLWDVDPEVIISENCNLSTLNPDLLEVAYYPNPTNGWLYINSGSAVIEQLTLLDASGKQLDVSLQNNRIDLSKLSPGIYFLRLKTNKGHLVEKVIRN